MTHSVLTIDMLRGQSDLYAALRQVGRVAPTVTLSELLDALDQGDSLARDTAHRLRSVDQEFLRAVLRIGAGNPAFAQTSQITAFLAASSPAPLFLPPIDAGPSTALLTQGQRPDMPAFSDRAFDAWFAALQVPYGLGSYGEARSVYQTDQFADAASPERRTVHTGIDVFAPAMTPVYAPLSGRVRHVTYNADPLDYGHTLIMEHDAGGVAFYTLYGHLAGTLPDLMQVGQRVQPGQLIAHLGDWHENGGWAAHLHFQIMTDMLEQTAGNFYGVGHDSLWDVWSNICIDPNVILRLPVDRFQIA